MLGISIVIFCIGLVSSQITSNTCGLRPLVPNDEDYDRIVGGAEVVRGDHPWGCSMRLNGNHICGCSLLNSQWVVTAAHCVSGSNPNPAPYTFVFGLHDRLTNDPWSVVSGASFAVRHPAYNARLIQNDIALFQLSSPVSLSNYIMPVCFPAVTDTFENDVCIATGWGSTQSGGSLARYEQEVSMPVLTDAECNRRFDGTSNMLDEATQVCAGVEGANKDTCQGDSGGPLVVKRNGRWYLIGLTSWGYGCGDGGVYTRVSAYRDWVLGYAGSLPIGD